MLEIEREQAEEAKYGFGSELLFDEPLASRAGDKFFWEQMAF